MDNYEKHLYTTAIERITEGLELLHRFLGRLEAREDFRPDLRFVDDEEKLIPFPAEKKPSELGTSDGAGREFVEFSEQEIKQMPKIFKTLIIIQKKRCRIRRRECGNSETYEIRFRSDGYNVSACGKTRELAKANFLKKLQKAKPEARDRNTQNGVPTTFSAFATFYFENFRKKKVASETFKKDYHRLKSYLLPYFGEQPLTKITPTACATLIERVKGDGKGKTADELFSLMNVIFKSAIAHGILVRNPLDVVFHIQHESESGKALSREEEQILLDGITEPDYKRAIAISLYTGLRPNELETARIEGEFIVAKNSKRKRGKIEYKRIPIIARLRPFLKDGIGTLPPPQLIRRRINAVLPNHKLYDLRTTFYTRCDELGVAEPARDEFVGHSAGALTNAYRDLSNAYLLKEGKKLNKW